MADSHDVDREVARLHRFFERWFRGEDGATITEFSDVLDEAFFIVSPDGAVRGKQEIIDAVVSQRGASGVGISVENVEVAEHEPVVIARYEEIHRDGTTETNRISTAVMRRMATSPTGFSWLCVHETYVVAGTSDRSTPSRR